MGDPSTNRPTPTASGTLAKTPLLHLLLYAVEKKLTGTLELFAPDKRSALVLFAAGEPSKVRTSEPVAYLGQVLHELGFVDEEQLNRSLGELAKLKVAGPKLHGSLLIETGVVDGGKLRAGLAEQIGRKLRHMAAMPADSVYAYYDAFDALRGWGGTDSEGVDPTRFFWGMLREFTPWEHVNAALAKVAGSPLRLARGADIGRFGLAREEAAAAETLRQRPMRGADLAKTASLNERTAQLLAYLLLVTKQVDVLPTLQTPLPPGPASLPGPRSSSPPPISMRPKISTPAPHPSRPPVPPKSVPPAPPLGLSHELLARWKEISERGSNIDRADYFMMLDIARDATHEEVETAFFALAKRWHPDRLPPELAPMRLVCSRVFARMSEAHTTLADAQERARYMKLVAEGSGSPEMQETVAKVIEAAQNYQKAEVFLKRNDLVQAELFCRNALESDATQPDYLAMFAWLLALKPENQSGEKTLESIRMLDKAAGMNDLCEKAYYWRGMLYKRLGRTDLASKDFRRVVDLNPRNIDAAREVRLHQMRGGRPSTPPGSGRPSPFPPKSKSDDARQKGGLFGRLFKKP
jgi:tetratricopeptide (TPR) repeat protein